MRNDIKFSAESTRSSIVNLIVDHKLNINIENSSSCVKISNRLLKQQTTIVIDIDTDTANTGSGYSSKFPFTVEKF